MVYQGVRGSQHIEDVIASTSQFSEKSNGVAEDVITRSWVRCISDHGLDPTHQQPARIIEKTRLREHQEEIEEFLRVARGGMEHLYKRVSPLGYVLLLTDAHGVTVDYIGNDQWDRDLKRSGLCLGADWNEEHAGTCAVGTCIIEREPVLVHQGDHFDVSHISLTCTAIPLFDPMGQVIGVLDISALTSPSERASQHLAMHFTVGVAKMVEDANFIRHFSDLWIMRLGTDWTLVDVNSDCMIAFDAFGQILGANSGARKLLKAISADGLYAPLVGRTLTNVFKTSMDRIWKIANAGISSERTVLTTLEGQLFYAIVKVPLRSNTPRSVEQMPKVLSCPALDQLAGDDKAMSRLIDQAKRLVNKKINILLQGETGTGKEVVAKALHESSNRAKKSFIAVNCASIPESLIESELFGYTAGSFTGGRSKGARGLIMQSDGGTLFLDEIGDMPLSLQTRLLRVLSEREVTPLGASTPVPIELTVVAASHRDLRQLIADGSFREDLYYRLCGATLLLPPLRLRTDKSFIINRIMQQEGAQMEVDARISDAAFSLLEKFSWPGNVRQLRNVIRFALAVCEDGYIETHNLPQELEINTVSTPAEHPLVVGHSTQSLQQSASAAGAVVNISEIAEATASSYNLLSLLRKHRWNITAVANELNVCRATVYRHMLREKIVPPTHQ